MAEKMQSHHLLTIIMFSSLIAQQYLYSKLLHLIDRWVLNENTHKADL